MGRAMNKLGRGLPHPLASAPWVSHCDSLIMATTVFGMPILLKGKADNIAVSAVPPPQSSLPLQPSLPLQVTKCPRRNWELVSQMQGLLRMGARWLDTLHGAQMAAQEASGVMAAVMLRQQGVMREVSVWESEVEGVMREMSRLVDGAGPDM